MSRKSAFTIPNGVHIILKEVSSRNIVESWEFLSLFSLDSESFGVKIFMTSLRKLAQKNNGKIWSWLLRMPVVYVRTVSAAHRGLGD